MTKNLRLRPHKPPCSRQAVTSSSRLTELAKDQSSEQASHRSHSSAPVGLLGVGEGAATTGQGDRSRGHLQVHLQREAAAWSSAGSGQAAGQAGKGASINPRRMSETQAGRQSLCCSPDGRPSPPGDHTGHVLRGSHVLTWAPCTPRRLISHPHGAQVLLGWSSVRSKPG